MPASDARQHPRALKLQGLSDKTIDVYARAVGRLATRFDQCLDQLSTEQPEEYFAELVESHSWSTARVWMSDCHDCHGGRPVRKAVADYRVDAGGSA